MNGWAWQPHAGGPASVRPRHCKSKGEESPCRPEQSESVAIFFGGAILGAAFGVIVDRLWRAVENRPCVDVHFDAENGTFLTRKMDIPN